MIREDGLTQEGLKMLACVTMLIDHIGAVFVPGYALRIVGRLAFPIYCFLLTEGMAHTRNVKRYGIRLLIGAVLSEIPFDLLFFGRLTIRHQSVMVTLLLGYFMILWIRNMPKHRVLVILAHALAADLLNTDYGAMGVLVIALFALTRDVENPKEWQLLGMAAMFWVGYGAGWNLHLLHVPIQIFGVLAMVPICFYNGKKGGASRLVQWGFYLFYPVHLAVLLLLK